MNAYERSLRGICGSEERYRVLAFLFSHPTESFHLRGLAQETKVDPSNAARLLGRLVEAGLCTRSEDRIYVKYAARRDNPIFQSLVEMFSQTGEVSSGLMAVASRLPGVTLMFGSRARGEDRPDSDIDVLVINQESGISMAAEFKPISRRIKREIQVTTASAEDIVRALDAGSAFWHEVFNNPVIVLHGEVPDEIRRAAHQTGVGGVPKPPARRRATAKPRRSGR
ncbi:MAG: nucleotidyltransferase domain-containing protein [Gemmatimonadales bacterium]